jgi:hypothetical protein
MPVPKATVNKDQLLPSDKHNIRCPLKRFHVASVTVMQLP